MNACTPRYAIYFVPDPDTELYRLGAAVLGYDCHSGRDIAPPDGFDPVVWPAVAAEPRVYGFHATLKAPFHLADGASENNLMRALIEFAEDQPAVFIGDLIVRALGSFIALVPKVASPQLDRLARACVSEFDPMRAPLSDDERSRRLKTGLSLRQTEYLNRWGYPYVFDDFRFHMTLTGPCADGERAAILRLLCHKFEQTAVGEAITLDRIVVARQRNREDRFEVIRSAQLGQSPRRPFAYTI